MKKQTITTTVIVIIALAAIVLWRDRSSVFSDPSLGLSFAYPSGYEVVDIPQDGGDALVVRPSDDSGKYGYGVQIFVATDTDDTSFSAQSIAADNPTMPMASTTDMAVSGVHAVEFYTDDTKEVWLATGERLYEISALIGYQRDIDLEGSVARSIRVSI